MKRTMGWPLLALVGAMTLAAVQAAHAAPPPAPAPAQDDGDLGAWSGGWPGAFAFLGEDDMGPPGDREFAPDGAGGGAGFRGRGMRRHGGPGGPGMGMRGERGGRMWEGLGLSADQQQRMQDIREKAMRRSIQARADLRLARLDLARLMRADRPDRRAIDAQLDRIGTMRSGMQKARVDAMLDARSVLTDEQRQKLREMRSSHGMRRMGRDDGSRREDDDEGR